MAAPPNPAPALVLVPGMSSLASIVYRPLLTALTTAPHNLPSVTAVDLPSVDAMATHKTALLKPSGLHADIAAIRAAITARLDEGRDVVVVAHSYGGTPSLYAIGDDLWKKSEEEEEEEEEQRGEEEEEGGKVGVRRAILLCGSLTMPGGTVAGDREEYKAQYGGIDDGEVRVEACGDDHFVIPTGFENVWMPDVPDQEFRGSLRPSPLSTVMTPTPEADVSAWRISYLVTKGDLAMPEGLMMGLVERARERGAEVETKTIESGHFVQISHVDEVAEWVVQSACR